MEILESGSAKMRPRARLIGLIGDELISDEPVALVELVKNAYDADATEVTVRFEGKDPDSPDRIVVEDNGIGMNLDTVLEGWFEPGTILKRKQKRSPAGRLYQGAKGIGRFAAARLAKFLVLETIEERQKKGVFVLLNWGDFDDESYLDEVSIDYEVRDLPDLKRGTRLTLETLRKEWTEDDYKALHARLSRLISPFEEVKDFRIHLEIPAHSDMSGYVQPPELILEPEYQLKGELNEDGYFTGEILLRGKPKKEIKKIKLGGADEKPLCKSFQVEIRAWDRDRPGLEPLAKRFDMSLLQIRQTLNAYCGVSIYRDGFRVHPYGQKGNDWLNLDIRSRQNPVKNLANNQVVASIKISREKNPELKDRSTREGMVYNPEHSALEEWYKNILSLLEEERYGIRPRDEKPVYRVEPVFEALDISDTVELVKKDLGRDHAIALHIVDTEKRIREGIESLQELYSHVLMTAGLGHMVDIVIHEIGSPLGKIDRELDLLMRDLKRVLSPELLDKISPRINKIQGWLEQIYNLKKRLEPQTPAKRGRATTFDVYEEIEECFNLYQVLISRQNITYSIQSPDKPLWVKMSKASLGQIVANLIDNSIYWLIKNRGVGKGGKIKVSLGSLKHGFNLIFCDDGPGVAEEDHARIFEPYFTRKPDGMGLGLYIARLVIEPYGKLLYSKECELAGACFEARFERSVGR